VKHKIVLRQLGAGERENFLNGAIDIEPSQLGPGFFCQCAEVFDYLCRAPAVLVDVRQYIPHFLEIGLVPVGPVQAGVGIDHDAGQGLVDLMGNGGDEFAHRRQPANAGEFRLGPLAFDHVIFKDLDRRRHRADLVVATNPGHFDGTIAFGERCHGAS